MFTRFVCVCLSCVMSICTAGFGGGSAGFSKVSAGARLARLGVILKGLGMSDIRSYREGGPRVDSLSTT